MQLYDYSEMLLHLFAVKALWSSLTVQGKISPFFHIVFVVSHCISNRLLKVPISFLFLSREAKKLCKKLKATPEPMSLKHYKNGEFHKDYDRKMTVQSMVSFMRDPSGDAPWEEEDSANDVKHIEHPDVSL